MQNVLLGANLQGRIYALEALLVLTKIRHKKLSQDDQQKILKLLQVTLPVSCCNGCRGSKKSTKDVLLFIKKNLQFKVDYYTIVQKISEHTKDIYFSYYHEGEGKPGVFISGLEMDEEELKKTKKFSFLFNKPSLEVFLD